MGYIQQAQNEYYNDISQFGSYQFISLNDVISQFMVAYVGDNKIIQNTNRSDVAFFAQRALQEFSFDVFKSIKSQQIDLPPSLTMIIPQDYVNYTKLSSVDNAGIKHVLYPTRHTSNPFQIKQNDNGSYFFGVDGSYLEETNIVLNGNFDVDLDNTPWQSTRPGKSSSWDSFRASTGATTKYYVNNILDKQEVSNGELSFSQLWMNGFGVSGPSRAYGAWQELDVTFENTLDIKAIASSGSQQLDNSGNLICDFGVVRVGLTSKDPNTELINPNGVIALGSKTAPGPLVGVNIANMSPHFEASNYDLLDENNSPSYLEWSDGTTGEKELLNIDVSGVNKVWMYIQTFSPWQAAAITTITNGQPFNGSTIQPLPATAEHVTHQVNSIDFVSAITQGQYQTLTENSPDGNSSTWNNYKSHNPSENNINDYQDYQNDIYWPNQGERYGLEPQHAQVNGSFYIDERLGKINFSSNLSGKTVILDYISDSLGTDEEMKVHKLAEEAMYKHIAYSILSTSANPLHQQLAPRFKKEKFAESRKAKLRLSNIKLEEITQILRGKSKQIKH